MTVILKFVKGLVLSVLIASGIILLALFLFEWPLPHFALEKICARLSNTNIVVRCDSIRVRYPSHVSINGLRVYDCKKLDIAPMLSASHIAAEVNLLPPWDTSRMLKELTIRSLSYPRLPEGYYIPDSIEFPGSPDFKECDEPVVLSLPVLKPFRLRLKRPAILGLNIREVTFNTVECTGERLQFGNMLLHWPDADAPMKLDGEVALDLERQEVVGFVHGQARQNNIRPMLERLDITNSYQFIDGFTGVTTPVDATCKFDVNLRNNDLHLFLDLHPTGGAYHNVPMINAHGLLDIRVFVRDTFQNARIVVGPIVANLTDEKAMSGSIIYENTNDIGYVNFDVRSTTSLSNALAVADVLTDGTLDCLQPTTSPTISLRGVLAVDPKYAATNAITGTIAFEDGTLFGIPLHNAETVFTVRGTDVSFTNAKAQSPNGGTIMGDAIITVPEFKQENANFEVTLNGKDVPLPDVTNLFNIDIGKNDGMMNGSVTLSGPLSSMLADTIDGHGHLECKGGKLTQMKLFAGFTDYLAKTVPGIAGLVNQSYGSVDFKLLDGLLTTDNLVIEGNVFSIHAKGSYSIPEDKIDFRVMVQLFRNDTIIDKITAPIIWPFSKLLMEFKVLGSLDKPEWKYVTIIDRVIDIKKK